MLLELAGVPEDDERVQRAVAVGRERRERARLRPEQRGGWLVHDLDGPITTSRLLREGPPGLLFGGIGRAFVVSD
jgi:hypothetical protein